MASTCSRFFSRTTTSALRSTRRSASKPPSTPSLSGFSPSNKANSPPLSRVSLSRNPSELGGTQSLLPLHSAVALARMTSGLSTSAHRCRSHSQDDIDGT